MQDEDASCYSVNTGSEFEKIDYDAMESFVLERAEDCNCSIVLHTFHNLCAKVCGQSMLTSVDWMEVMIPAILYLLVFIVGTLGNALVIFVVNRFKRMRNVTNVFLASLSTADLCLIWFCVPVMFVKYMSHEWFMGRFACYSVHYIQQFTCFCSVLTMTMISFERFLAIAYPMRNMWLSSIGRAKKVILLIWLASAILAIPSAIKIDYQVNGNNQTRVHWCARRFPAGFRAFGRSQVELNRIYAIYQMLLLIVFPVVTMSVCYTRVSLIVYSSSKDRGLLTHAIKRPPVVIAHVVRAVCVALVAFSKAATDAVSFSSYSSIPIAHSRTFKFASTAITSLNNKKSNRIAEANKKQIVQMLISIVVMYTVCWLPTIIDELLTSFDYICRTSNTTTLKHMRMGFNALTYCQSCINPICYAFISQNFRATFKTAYIRMKYRIQGNEDLRSRMGSYSSASVLSTRNHHRITASFNTLTVPGRSIVITPNMSRDCSQMSLCRPRTPGGIMPDAPTTAGIRRSTLMQPCGPPPLYQSELPPGCKNDEWFDGTTQNVHDFIDVCLLLHAIPFSTQPRSPTDVSRDSGRPRSPTDVSLTPRPKSCMRARSPTETSQGSRPRSPTTTSTLSKGSKGSRGSVVRMHTEVTSLLSVQDAIRPRTPEAV